MLGGLCVKYVSGLELPRGRQALGSSRPQGQGSSSRRPGSRPRSPPPPPPSRSPGTATGRQEGLGQEVEGAFSSHMGMGPASLCCRVLPLASLARGFPGASPAPGSCCSLPLSLPRFHYLLLVPGNNKECGTGLLLIICHPVFVSFNNFS